MKPNNYFMKKKINFALASMVALGMTMTSCSSDEPMMNEGGNVSFTVELPETIGSRAYSDGLTATNLHYYVYDEDNGSVYLQGTSGTATFTDRKAEVNLNLVSGKSYSIVFWADAPDNNIYSYNTSTKEVTVSYVNMAAQDENRDAFCVYEGTFKVTGPINKTITLTRPLAQINVGTSDLAKAQASGINLTKTGMKVKGVYNTLNVATGEVSGDADVTYTQAALPTGETFPVGGYNYLAMNYVLVGAEKSTVDVTMTSDNDQNPELTFAAVPVQRNYRTNIYGALLTDPANFNVIIDKEYEEPDYSYSLIGSQAEFVAALNAGQAEIVLKAGEYVFDQTWCTLHADTKIIGVDKENTVVKFAKSVYTEGKALTLENLTVTVPTGLSYNESAFAFLHRTGDVTIKDCIYNGSLRLNIQNGKTASVENCTFNINVQGGFDGYAIFYYGATGSKVNVKNCTFNTKGKGIVMYSESAQVFDLTVSDCTFTNQGETSDKAAIQMHTEWGISGNLHINDVTATNFDATKNGGLWCDINNTNKTPTRKFNVWVNGEQVQVAE